MKFKVYSRKSVFTGRGESIENQIEMCKNYIFQNYPGTTEADIQVYEDEGHSGKNLDRPHFQKMMQDIRQEKPDCIVCYRLDRISRNVGDFASLIEKLNEKNIAFVCIKEKFDTSTPMGKAMMYIASVFAQLERETIAERVRDNMLMLAKLGRWLGGTTPTGYTSEKTQEVIFEGKLKSSCKLKEDPEEIRIIDLIYEKFLQLRSLNGVRKYLAAHGMKSRTGKFFSLPSIKDILKNPVYCTADQDAWDYFNQLGADLCFEPGGCTGQHGLLAYNKRDYTKGHAPRNAVEKWVIAAGKHRGRISGKQWAAVQKILAENRPGRENKIKPGEHNDYALLSGMILCKKCGKRMFAKNRSGGRIGFDYICQDKLQLGAGVCGCPNLNGQNADDTVCEYLLSYTKENTGLCTLLENLKREIKGADSGDSAERIQKRLDTCNQEMENLVAVLAQTGANRLLVEKVNERVSVLAQELTNLQEKRKQIESGFSEEAQQAVKLDLLVEALSDFQSSFSNMTIHEKRAFVRLLVQKCEWDGESFDIFIYGE